jgi:two-component system, chemotaxis family, chemotaxis protein CheY
MADGERPSPLLLSMIASMFPPETKILVAEDSPLTRKVIEVMLQRLGFSKVTGVPDGHTAWLEITAFLSRGPAYGLVISDWKMPRLSGLALLQKLRGDARTRSLPFILLTAINEREDVMAAVEARVTAYLAKPFPLEGLEAKLKEAWGQP